MIQRNGTPIIEVPKYTPVYDTAKEQKAAEEKEGNEEGKLQALVEVNYSSGRQNIFE